MDPEAFTSSFFKWDPRGVVAPVPAIMLQQQPQVTTGGTVGGYGGRPPPPGRELGGIEELFQAYGIRYYTAARIAELGFTVSTLVGMKEEELEDMMNTVSQVFRWELLVGERYGIKAAVRAERRRLQEEEEARRRQCETINGLDALSQEGLSEEPVVQQQEIREAAGSGGGVGGWEMVRKQRRRKTAEMDGVGDDDDDDGVYERQREHPFIVTEPGEVARGKKNGLDYLFHLYEQCREFLHQVQIIAKDRGEKCPTKVLNSLIN